MKIWQKIVLVISVLAVLVCTCCISGFAYVSDYGNRYLQDTYYYTTPFNIGIRTRDSQWLSFANTPYLQNDVAEDKSYWFNYSTELGEFNAYVDTESGKLDGYVTQSVYVELNDLGISNNYYDRVIGNYMPFKKDSTNHNSEPFAIFDVDHEYSTNGPKLELRYSAYYYGADGNLYSQRYTKTLKPIASTKYDTYYSTKFGVILGDFVDVIGDGVGNNGTTAPVVYYGDISITALNVNHTLACEITGFKGRDIGITTNGLSSSTAVVELINNDILGWIATSVDSLMSAYIIPPSSTFGGLTLGGLFAIALAVPLVIAFLKMFRGG